MMHDGRGFSTLYPNHKIILRIGSLVSYSSFVTPVVSKYDSNVIVYHPFTVTMNPTTEVPPATRSKMAILRVQGPDRKGIVAAFAQVLYGQ
jgi:glycine cleavage system regulatory protein